MRRHFVSAKVVFVMMVVCFGLTTIAHARGGWTGWYRISRVEVRTENVDQVRLYIWPDGYVQGASDCPRTDAGGGIISTLPIGHPATQNDQQKVLRLISIAQTAKQKGMYLKHYTNCVDNHSQYIEGGMKSRR